jgi:heme/copper-type cytochrome/quinol oxidase subunit 2
MDICQKRIDFLFLILIVLILIGLPLGIWSYDYQVWRKKVPVDARIFTLTGHTQKGWVVGELPAYNTLTTGLSKQTPQKPVIEVSRGDRVVLKLKSSDVIHGFSLKDFGIFVSDGIHPGKVVLVSFVADRTGTFQFSCNAICGDNHQNMQGTLVVKV